MLSDEGDNDDEMHALRSLRIACAHGTIRFGRTTLL